MRDELLAYLLNDLDSEQRSRIEARLDSDPIWQHELERLRSYVDEAHEAGRDETDTGEALPTDLVNRTCSFVKQASAQGALSPAVLPASLTESCDAAPPTARRWSRLDLAVAAGIFLAIGSLLLPALRESRDTARRLQCQEKLRSLGTALATYADQSHGQLPSIERHENAGMFAVKLIESGVLTRAQLAELLVCPSTKLAEEVFAGKTVINIPTRIELTAATGAKLRTLLEHMGGSFAYRIGYFDEQGNYHQVKFVNSSNAPMMADKPSFAVVGFQSANHGGCGQNVAFQDLSVRYVRICMQDGPDRNWYLNEDDQQAAGKNQFDIVLGRSEVGPAGLLPAIRKTVTEK